jgi:hypothetical protein
MDVDEYAAELLCRHQVRRQPQGDGCACRQVDAETSRADDV